MGKLSGKRNQRYVYPPRDIYKLTCIIHGFGHSSDECKLIKYFSTKYATVGSFKQIRKEPTSNKNIGKKQELNDIVQHAVDDIILQKTKKKILLQEIKHMRTLMMRSMKMRSISWIN